MNTYICFFNGRQAEIKAATSYAAQVECARVHRIPDKKRHTITVMLAEKSDGQAVMHTPAE